MSSPKRPIFRQAAVQRYIQSREKSVLPRLVSPKVFGYLWLLLALLLAGGAVAWSAKVPIYASGLAVVVADPKLIHPKGETITLALFLPHDQQASLQEGNIVYLQPTRDGTRVHQPILLVEPMILSPAAAQRRFALPPGVATRLNEPVAVALIQMATSPSTLPSEAYTGSVYQAEIEIGSQRVITLMPGIGQFWRDTDAS